MKKETGHKRDLVKALKVGLPGCVVFRHEDRFTGGIPDISVTWNGLTAWIEVKYHRRGRQSRLSALQALVLGRIRETRGIGLLLEYQEDGGASLTGSGEDYWSVYGGRPRGLNALIVDQIRGMMEVGR